jgi:hypothetical protein
MNSELSIVGHSVAAALTASASRIDLPKGDIMRFAVNQVASGTGAWVKLGTNDVVAAVGTASTVATSTLTSSNAFSAGEQAIVGGRTYTFVASLTVPAVPGEVLIGANQTASHLNLLRAINAGAGAGSLYATGTLIHPTVTAISSNGTTTVINAKTPGTAGNSIGTTEGAAAAAMANASWTSTVMASGADGVETSFYVHPSYPVTVKIDPSITHASCIGVGADAVVSILGLSR